ncbi:hypothetical protein [Aureibaculum conchae]|uniref:hypothetical protein n=1 Tax=Aureibaculum sp. 2308TA14-22 TaxID=3108392 RepID=UPI0033970858
MKNFKVEANELLQRNELKSVFGGSEPYCTVSCKDKDENGDNIIANCLDCIAGSMDYACQNHGGSGGVCIC